MHSRKIISLTAANAIQPELRLHEPVNLDICQGEQIAIIGPNGAGKSLLTDLLTGTRPMRAQHVIYDFAPGSRLSDHIRLITFKDVYGSNFTPAYYQQRWNQGDAGTYPTLAEILCLTPQQESDPLFASLRINELMPKRIIELSSGELRRFQLALGLRQRPSVLILDNPLIGLDAFSRPMILQTLARLSQQMQLILVVSREEDIPDFITHVVRVEHRVVAAKMPLADYRKMARSPHAPASSHAPSFPIQKTIAPPSAHPADAVCMNDVNIRYGSRTILSHLNWRVRQGERWILSGVNGAGKSTLLSLIYADNPQAYACNITLFGKKRGSGESIWDIKKRIGYVSPEMFRCFNKNIPALEVVANSMQNTVGFFKKATPAQKALSRKWMEILGISHLAERLYPTLSSGEQRLILLARAFVKDPELLILDEPFHGLDDYHTACLKDIIDHYCRQSGCSLIMVSHYSDEYPTCIDHELHLEKQI